VPGANNNRGVQDGDVLPPFTDLLLYASDIIKFFFTAKTRRREGTRRSVCDGEMNCSTFTLMYLYLKAIHIIFVVTWFAGLFYMPRLFIYATEANDRPEAERKILRQQFGIMMKRLWYGITWPSAILTLVLGPVVMFQGNWDRSLFQPEGKWLLIKLLFVIFLYLYHWSIHRIFQQETKGVFRYSSKQLRIWNEVATVFLIAIVMLAVVKQQVSLIWGLLGLVLLLVVLMSAIRVYRLLRNGK
jgi:putative membrane protein